MSQSAEQLRYALLLDWGTRIGLVALVLSFTVYASGLLPPYVELQELPSLWSLPVDRYLELTSAPTGWSWVMHLGHGDVAALIGIVVMASCSLPCLLALLPLALGRGDRAFAALAAAEVVVILLAASGLIGPGH